MRAYLAIKYHDDFSNKRYIEAISSACEKAGINTTVMARDYEKWGKIKLGPKKLMQLTFKEIEKADVLIIEFSEKGVGLGIEAGYAHSIKIPIIVVAKRGSDISETLKGIAKKVILYNKPEELERLLRWGRKK